MHLLPILTHLPYTTLFRSHAFVTICDPQFARPTHQHLARCNAHEDTHEGLLPGVRLETPVKLRHRGHVACPCQVECTLDRKSTRLNSSHPSIPYAVFCLK